jgi:hypothetical protein
MAADPFGYRRCLECRDLVRREDVEAHNQRHQRSPVMVAQPYTYPGTSFVCCLCKRQVEADDANFPIPSGRCVCVGCHARAVAAAPGGLVRAAAEERLAKHVQDHLAAEVNAEDAPQPPSNDFEGIG